LSVFRPPLILASASPRRRDLLREYGYKAEIMPPPIPEPRWRASGLAPPAHAEAMSYFKAAAVANLQRSAPGASSDRLILGADTVVALGPTILGKPTDRADAGRILRALAGTTHRVITGVTLLEPALRRRRIAHDTTTVAMRSLTEDEVNGYLDSDDWIGKAGAYGIQDRGDAFVEHIDGSFTNVVGLPMELLARMLNSWTKSAQTG